MITILVQIEGVLADTRQPALVDNGPIREGLVLLRSLRTTAQVVMYTAHPEDRATYWLQREHIEEPLKMLTLVSNDGIEEMITKCRFGGNNLTLMLSADPSHIVAAYRQGLQALLCVHPSYGRPEWRPDYEDGVRPWDEMVEEIVDKRVSLASDGRTKAERVIVDG